MLDFSKLEIGQKIYENLNEWDMVKPESFICIVDQIPSSNNPSSILAIVPDNGPEDKWMRLLIDKSMAEDFSLEPLYKVKNEEAYESFYQTKDEREF